ncbi:cyclic nucleotide-binding domain-containing protein 1 [Oncorhynchus kisutch]|uniref:Cyclic nucleotide binding domain containing 1 n=1 Tax=Oncorhynchus kisutch TaxID=8019 RepID=A0A8C7ITY1_ONCKI|nr:cyclic nucleotide-binding domain-containing protein 1 [Oncorhynchus kisutch]
MQLHPSSLQRKDDQQILGIDYSNLKALCRIHGLRLRDSNRYQSTEEAHNNFMNSYRNIFILPKKMVAQNPFQTDSKVAPGPEKLKASESQEVNRNQGHGRQTQETLINQMIKALKKFPIERSQLEHHSIHKMLKVFPCLTAHLSRHELQQISTIAIIETWDRAQIIFGHNGFYLILKGSVAPYTQERSKEAVDPKGSVIGVGGSFGSFEPPAGTEAGITIQCTLTQETCEILKISHSGYAKLKKEILAQNYALKESLIQGCHFYLQWPKLSIDRLANIIQMKNLPAKHVLAKEGKVCPFVAYIREGECNILQDINSLMRTPQEKGSRIKFVVVGKLGPMESFGEVSILLDQPSPCSIVTATEVQVGIIQPDALKGLDSVTSALMLQTAQPTYGKLSREEINKEYIRQERHKEWDHIKKRVLSDALLYNGIQQGNGKWTFTRGGGRRSVDKSNPHPINTAHTQTPQRILPALTPDVTTTTQENTGTDIAKP